MSELEKQWEGLTHAGTLPVGVWYAGSRHRDYVLRPGIAGDLITAHAKTPGGIARAIDLGLFREQLLRLGDIPSEAITYDLLAKGLFDVDLAELTRADAELGKKLAPPSDPSSTGGASSTS